MRSNKINNTDLFTSAANYTFNKHIKTQSKQALEIIKSKIDWEKLLKPLEKVISKQKENNSPAGRRTIDLLVIVKCFILQTIYNLSDPRLEEEIADRRSFQIFLELNSLDSISDETTICRYREMFARLGLDKKLFCEFNQQLKSFNLIVGKGTIVDATIKQAQATSGSNRVKDADFTQKRGKTYYGYKGHIAIDEESEIIKTVEFTKASLHDSNAFEQLVDYTEEAIFADKAYANKNRRKKLEKNNIFDGILAKGYRNKTLSKAEIRFNRLLSTVRNKVERPFAYMKRILNYQRCSYYDLNRNRFEFIMSAFFYNIRKGSVNNSV
ncbi:MAG TPA: IS5 family transposase [Candidatus Pacearchaeota archaeon]|nr:IS5 family transposase [Candidatus Pacearchaeota archaeon]